MRRGRSAAARAEPSAPRGRGTDVNAASPHSAGPASQGGKILTVDLHPIFRDDSAIDRALRESVSARARRICSVSSRLLCPENRSASRLAGHRCA